MEQTATSTCSFNDCPNFSKCLHSASDYPECRNKKKESKPINYFEGLEAEEVFSSQLKRIGYHRGSERLIVEFKGGSFYQYLMVPSPMYEGLKEARSPGSYLSNNIKGKFEYKKLN